MGDGVGEKFEDSVGPDLDPSDTVLSIFPFRSVVAEVALFLVLRERNKGWYSSLVQP